MLFPIIKRLKWWQKYFIRFHSNKMYFAVDPACNKCGDMSCKVSYKKIKGVYYILKCEHEGDLK